MKDFEKKPDKRDRARCDDAFQVVKDSANGPLPSVDRQASPEGGALIQTMRKLQQSFGNRFVQRLLDRIRSSRPNQGQAIDPAARAEMEAALGEDFSDVRIHVDPEAQAQAERLGARALTHGRDVYFNTGEYRPSDEEGRKLLAHELVHVAQHGAGRKPRTASTGATGIEQEAEQAETAVASGQAFQVRNRESGTAIHCKQKEKKDEKPAILRHGKIITPMMRSGVVDAGGRFTVSFSFSTAPQVVLTLQVPGGVAVTVTPLGGAESYTVQDSGVMSSRAVSIAVSAAGGGAAARLQVTFTQGGFTYIVVFEFAQMTGLPEPTHPEGGGAG